MQAKMSSKKYASPLRFNISASNQLISLLFLLHFISLILLFFLPLPIFFLIVSGIFFIVSGIYTIKFHGLKNLPTSIVSVVWADDAEWLLFDKRGKKTRANLDGNSFIHPWCTVLVFKQKKHFFSKNLILISDNIDKDDFRRLRVRLKITNFSVESN